MASYSSTPREGEPTASLILHGWDTPHTWEGNTEAPDRWPHAAVQSLIHLFTDPDPNQDPDPTDCEGTEIPEVLGHHIAVLIDDWCTLDFDQNLMALMPRSSNLEFLLQEEPRARLKYGALVVQRRAQQNSHIQTWYSQGIALFQAWITDHPNNTSG